MSKETSTTYKGTSIKDICNGKGHWSFPITPVNPSKYHYVLYNVPVNLQSPPEPFCAKDVALCDDDHVKMPNSEKNLFVVQEDNSNVIKERWKIINEALKKPIKNFEDFESAINEYNSNLPKFEALQYFFKEDLSQEESDSFFTDMLPNIISLALGLPELLPSGIPLLKQNRNRSLSMSQLQIACLLANAFLCTFPWKKSTAATYPGVNFISLFSAFARPKRNQCICEKLKSICNYFKRVTQNVPLGVVTFERKMIPRSNMPRWDTLDNNLGNTKIHITSEGTIEDNGLGFLQVDFANKNIGGGVLRYGCVQEEIRFVICPELIISRLFVEQLANGESVIITGAERYNNYTGYGDTYEWAGDCQDETPFDVYGRRKTTICVIDATRFDRPKDQFQSSMMIRELNKAYVGFSSREKHNLAPVATGNWGCGAFKGSKPLKILIQLMACSAANRNLVYYSFGDIELMENFSDFHLFLGKNQITIAQLWRFLCQFSIRGLSDDKLFSFIEQAYFDSKKQPTISHFFGKAATNPQPSTFKKDPKPIIVEKSPKEINMDIESPTTSTLSNLFEVTDETPSSEEIIPSSQPSSPKAKKLLKTKKSTKSHKDILNKLPKTDIMEIFDMLDGNANKSLSTSNSESPEIGVLSTFDKFSTKKNVESSTFDKFCTKTNNEALEEIVVIKEDREELMEVDVKDKGTDIKKKITDYFNKTSH
ncbi:unnamed protein product [Ceutorhynchus assimilis]|uniref:poly(ADP-ribose) glycohydrolase n=1 Tax=Ceutorhynchus assimilis TaxID=467358 RepID=A0A9N9ML59_9CUCU|nr:unnamed protein product [Ceutorhynchus assimilis]